MVGNNKITDRFISYMFFRQIFAYPLVQANRNLAVLAFTTFT